jgi:hypothetical protein
MYSNNNNIQTLIEQKKKKHNSPSVLAIAGASDVLTQDTSLRSLFTGYDISFLPTVKP